MNTTVRGSNDLKNVTIPFLGEIPYCISRKNQTNSSAAHPVLEEAEGDAYRLW